VTDANVMLGRIQPEFFPRVFGPRADQPLDHEAVAQGFRRLAAQIEAATGMRKTAEDVAAGFLDIAVRNMAEAIKKISVQRGHDVTKYTLSVFGGAGGQHACAVADQLAMTRIFAHPLPACCPPTEWGWPTRPRCARRRSSCRWPVRRRRR